MTSFATVARSIALLCACGVSACTTSPRPDVVSPKASSASRPALKKPSDARASRLAALVAKLGAQPRYEGSHLYLGGKPSTIHPIYVRIVALAEPQEMLRLLSHGSEVVRYYAARWVITKQPRYLPKLYSMLADPTELEAIHGCVRQRKALGLILLDSVNAWRTSASNGAAYGKLVERAAKDPEMPLVVRETAQRRLKGQLLP